MRKKAVIAALGCSLAVAGMAPSAASTGHTTAWTTFTVDTTADTVDAVSGDRRCADSSGGCSLRAAFQTASETGGEVRIVLAHDRYPLSVSGSDDDSSTSGDLDIAGSVHLEGNGATVVLSALGDRGFDVAAGGALTVRDLRVHGARPATTHSGGAFRSAGWLRLESVQATDNRVVGAGASGGAVFNDGGHLEVVDSYLADNAAARAGGAIEAAAGTTRVHHSVVMRNHTGDQPGNGGGLHLTGPGVVEVARSLVSGNVAAAEGGGLWNSASGTMHVRESEISDNVAKGTAADMGGGGIFNDGGHLHVELTALQRNTANEGSGSGGGLFNNAGRLDVVRSAVIGNSAARAGGGVETLDGDVVIERSQLAHNVTGPSPGNGGAVHVSGADGHVRVRLSSVTDNVAAREGGGLWAGSGNSTMTVELTDVSRNEARGGGLDDGGGGLFNNGGALVVDRSAVRDNRAVVGSGSGGGLLNLGTTTVTATRITGNRAANEGGGLWNSAIGRMIVERTTVTGNAAPLGPDLFQQPGTPADGLVVDGAVVPAGGGV